MTTRQIEKPSGILNPDAGAQKFQLTRYAPARDLCFCVERYWIVEWDLRGQAPYLQENIPHPCVNLVFERGTSRVVGVIKRKFSVPLEDQGRVFGVKFKPGAFRTFLQAPVCQLTDRSLSLEAVFSAGSSALEEAILAQTDHASMIALAEQFLHERLPARDETVCLINDIVDSIIADHTVTKVDDLVARFSLSKRTLQRIFSQYVGVSPKWVIKRYRLQEAADQLAVNGDVWPHMALELGYFDQAHFIKDFKMIVGQTPMEYVRNIGRTA